MAISHAAALLASRGRGRVAALPGDVRRPDAILASPELTALIDLSKRFCAVLDFVEPAQAADMVAVFRRAMPSGSFLIISLGINNNTPDVAELVIATYTARNAVGDRVAGLTLGGDDYITKPFRLDEVLARVQAVLRRSRGEPDRPARLRVADPELDEESHEVWRRGQVVSLAPNEFKLL